MKGTASSAAVGNIASSARPPDTSLIPAAPAATAARATSARMVSTVTAAPARLSSVITGSTRDSSTSKSGRTAPGRVDSPPTSSTSAPCSSNASP
jgi:hypothetical protein